MSYRNRTKGFLNPCLSSWSYRNVEYCEQQDSGTHTLTKLQSGTTKSMTDVVVPDFHRRSERGEIFCNPLWSVTVEESYAAVSPVHVTKANVCGTGKNYDCQQEFYPVNDIYGSFLPGDTSSFGDLAKLAGTSAVASVMEPTVFTLVEIAEAKETMKMLHRPLDDARKFIERVKRTRRYLRHGGNISTFLAENWLKYRYGLTPLALSMMDIISLATADKSSRRQTARGYASVGGIVTTGTSAHAGGALFSAQRAHATTSERSVRAGILYDYEFKWLAESGISLTELPSATWEMIPYSFVVDWFINAGDYIRAITPKTGVNYLSSWTTTRDVQDAETDITYTLKVPGYTVNSQPAATQRRVTTTLWRSPGVSVGLASKVPQIDFSTPKDWIHLADGLTLLGLELRRKLT